MAPITITPTTTLTDIAIILSEQNQVLGMQAQSTDKLQKSFSSYLQVLKAKELSERDEGETDSSSTKSNDRPTSAAPRGGLLSGIGDMFSGMASFNPLAFLRSVVGAFFSKGIILALGLMLADEVKDAITNITGSDFLGGVAEWTTIGGAIGLMFGKRFGLYGAIFGAMFSDQVREKIADALSALTLKEIEGTDNLTLGVAGAISTLAIALLPKLTALLFSPAGLLGAALIGSAALSYKYYTDDEFRAKFDKEIQAPVTEFIQSVEDRLVAWTTDTISSMIDAAKESVNEAVGFNMFTTKRMEEQTIDNMSKPEQEALQEQQAAVATTKQTLVDFNRADEEGKRAILEREGISTEQSLPLGAMAGAAYQELNRRALEAEKAVDTTVVKASEAQKYNDAYANTSLEDLQKQLMVAQKLAPIQTGGDAIRASEAKIAALEEAIANRQNPVQIQTAPSTTGATIQDMQQQYEEASGSVNNIVSGDTITNNSSQNIIGNGALSTANPSSPHWQPSY